MDQLIKTLPAILAASGGSKEVTEAACIAAWVHAVGEALSINAVPVQFDGETLTVAVGDSIWQRQLEHLRPQLLTRLNYVLGHSIVKTIALRVDPAVVENSRPRKDEAMANTEYAVPFELLAAASEIEDADLRRAFLGAATSCIKRLEKG